MIGTDIPQSIDNWKIAQTLNCNGECCKKKYTVLHKQCKPNFQGWQESILTWMHPRQTIQVVLRHGIRRETFVDSCWRSKYQPTYFVLKISWDRPDKLRNWKSAFQPQSDEAESGNINIWSAKYEEQDCLNQTEEYMWANTVCKIRF